MKRIVILTLLLAFSPIYGQNMTISKFAGTTKERTSQVTATTTAATLIAANANRRSVLIRNTDASITVYIGSATVSSSNGMPLLAGESVVVDTIALIQVKSASGTPVVALLELYD